MNRHLAHLRRSSWTLLLLLGLVAAALPAAAGPQDRLERVEQDQGRVQEQLEQAQDQGDHLARRVAALDRKRAAVEGRVATLDVRIEMLDGDIARVEGRLVEAQKQLIALGERLDAIQTKLGGRRDLFYERAVLAYKAGPTAAVDTLLSSGDLSDLLDRVAYYESALDADAKLIEEIELLEAEVITERDGLERKKAEIAADKLALQEHRSALAQARDERADALAAREAAVAKKQALLADVRARSTRLRKIERQLEEESDRIEGLLARRAAASSSAVSPGGGGQLAWPTAGPVTSGFGYRSHPIFGDRRMHTGIDIGAPYGAPVWAADGGTVSYVGAMSGYGNVVILEHGGGLATTYNHLSSVSVGSGQGVTRGQHIASVGCTGYCTGPHLHFEVRVAGAPVDPLPYLR
ncbi:M23 family metallopeptidase [soil metagenome]